MEKERAAQDTYSLETADTAKITDIGNRSVRNSIKLRKQKEQQRAKEERKEEDGRAAGIRDKARELRRDGQKEDPGTRGKDTTKDTNGNPIRAFRDKPREPHIRAGENEDPGTMEKE